MDSETARAMIAVKLWSLEPATTRKAKPPTSFLSQANDILLASRQMGVANEFNDNYLLVSPDQFSADRFKDWLADHAAEIKAMFQSATK